MHDCDMADIEIKVECTYSGQNEGFEYDDESTLSQLISDLQEEGMAWAKGKQTPECGISVDGKPGTVFQGNELQTLSALGVGDGSVIRIAADITQA